MLRYSCTFELGIALLFFFTDPATTEIYTLSLHDALPIFQKIVDHARLQLHAPFDRCESVLLRFGIVGLAQQDRKSTRLNSSHRCISYAVFCLKKKKSNK